MVAYRAIWSLVFCLVVLALTRKWHTFTAVLSDRRASLTLAMAGLLIAVNWGIYVYGVTSDRTLDASMGYFMNPLVSALLGVLVLGEKLRRAQWAAFGIGIAAVAVLVLAYGETPWLALSLAISFGIYGLVKKRLGARVGVIAGLTVETLALSVLGVGYLGWLAANGTAFLSPFTSYGALMALAGPVTAVPLLLFAYAAARLPLSTMGMLQYTAPLMLFLLGWLAYGEPIPPERWVGFALIWLAVVVFAVDAARASRFPQLPKGAERP